MNLGGIKVSAAEIERIVMQVPGISEVAAIAVPPQEGGPDSLVLYLVLVAGEKVDPAHWKTLANSAIRQKLSPLFHVAEVVIVSELPRTASNKVMRRLLRNDYVAARSSTT
jgi:acetyl-CoA synthetase